MLRIVRGRIDLCEEFEGIDPVFDGLGAEVDAVHVGLEDNRVFVFQVDGLSWVLGDPLGLASSSEKAGLGDEDVRVKGEAFGL